MVKRWPKVQATPTTTPAPLRNKVVSRPTRVPVNKQTALLMTRPSWLHQPPAIQEPSITELRAKIAELTGELSAAKVEIRDLRKREEKHVLQLKQARAVNEIAVRKQRELESAITEMETKVELVIQKATNTKGQR